MGRGCSGSTSAHATRCRFSLLAPVGVHHKVRFARPFGPRLAGRSSRRTAGAVVPDGFWGINCDTGAGTRGCDVWRVGQGRSGDGADEGIAASAETLSTYPAKPS